MGDPGEVVEAIRNLRVRGAPAIGVAGAYALVLAAGIGGAAGVRETAPGVAAARPTAVNLRWAVERMLHRLDGLGATESREEVEIALLEEAEAIQREDEEACRAIGERGAALLGNPCTLLTHCNAGALATAGSGTALGIVYTAVDAGKRVRVYADETRPLLQGARLTAWELHRAGVPVTVIADSVAGSVLASGDVDAVIVGADRIAANGDAANKIGTYPLAVLASRHEVPFYVAAPLSTFDPTCACGNDIPIEERSPAELSNPFGVNVVPEGVSVYNPAFDVTPAALVTAWICETGVIRSPDSASIAAHLESGPLQPS